MQMALAYAFHPPQTSAIDEDMFIGVRVGYVGDADGILFFKMYFYSQVAIEAN